EPCDEPSNRREWITPPPPAPCLVRVARKTAVVLVLRADRARRRPGDRGAPAPTAPRDWDRPRGRDHRTARVLSTMPRGWRPIEGRDTDNNRRDHSYRDPAPQDSPRDALHPESPAADEAGGAWS